MPTKNSSRTETPGPDADGPGPDPLPEGFETFSADEGWVLTNRAPLRFTRDEGRLDVEVHGDVDAEGRFLTAPVFVITHHVGRSRARVRQWRVETLPTGGVDSYARFQRVASRVGTIGVDALMLSLQVIDDGIEATVADADGRPGPWREGLQNPTTEEALRWLATHADTPGPVDSGRVSALERQLRVKFPDAYRRFLRRTGGARFWGHHFYGLDADSPRHIESVAAATDQARHRGLFDAGVAIADNAFGGVDVLDLRVSGRAPVIGLGPDLDLDSTGTAEAPSFTRYLTGAVELASRMEAIRRYERTH